MVRIHPPESLRIPGEGSSAQGESGPKENPKGVFDGKPVNIPVPVYNAHRGRGRRRLSAGDKWQIPPSGEVMRLVGKSAG